MKESDWKVFKQTKKKAIETFCTNVLYECEEVIRDNSNHVHDRYVSLYRLVQSRDKKMAQLFDDHSRSKAALQLLLIRKEGLADENLVNKLSNEFRDETNPNRHGW
jgi:hypothetical protein